MNVDKTEYIYTTGTFCEELNCYLNIGINKGHARYWGAEEKDIEDIVFQIDEDQSDPKWNEQEYWGWYDYGRAQWDIIYPNYKLFNCCFPYGVKAEEDHNKGKSCRLKLIK